MKYKDIVNQQKDLCKRLGLEWVESPPYLNVGIAKNVREGMMPINGLRHHEEGDTTGWYIWAGGEIPQDDPGFFVALHVEHLTEWYPEIFKYLGLPPGWRFLIDDKGHEDIWEDKSLLSEKL
jgi:hypothetical protein